MKYLLSAGLVAATATGATAGGLDRSFQSVSPLFNESGTASVSFGFVNPSITGTDALGNSYDVGDTYTVPTISYTQDMGDKLTFGVIYDTPFGAAISYNNSPLTSTLGGTMADLTSDAINFLGKFQVTDRFSVFGGLRLQSVEAAVALNGQAYAAAISTAAVASTVPGLSSATLGAALGGDVAAATAIDTTYGAGTTAALGAAVGAQATTFLTTNGYNVDISEDHSVGYTLGFAYEIPDIALRFVATYHSEIEHNADTVENLFGLAPVASTITYISPQSVNLEFQTGIAADTLLIASYRWSEFSAVDVIPTALGADLVNLDDAHRYSIGVGRRFNDNLSGRISLSYEPSGDGGTVSPLGPTDGLFGISLGGQYVQDNVTISGGVNYSWLGDAQAGVAGQSVASFTDSTSLAFGVNVKITF